MKLFGKMKSLRSKILLTTIVVIFIVQGIYSGITIYYDYKANLKAFHLKKDAIIKELSESLTKPLWGYQDEQVNTLITVKFNDKEFEGIVIKEIDTDNVSVALAKKDNEIVKEEPVLHEYSIIDESELKHNNKVYWTAKFHFTKKYILLSVRQNILNVFISTFIIIAVLSTFLLFILNTIVITPIKKIKTIVTNITRGDLSIEELTGAGNDEFGMLFTLCNEMVDALKYKEQAIQRIADGDLRLDYIPASSDDSLGNAIKKMHESLHQILILVQKASNQVTNGANQIADASQTLSSGATQQASSLEEISASITEITAQAKLNAQNASQANSKAKEAVLNADKGNEQMQELISAMSNINNSASEIKKIVKTIDDIAFQINLLALNANVEAARAGKYGKGFAVVAEEVRNLANRSARSVKETTDMVENAAQNIVDGNKIVEVAAEQLNTIVHCSTEVVTLVEEIAMASREQSRGLEEVNQGVARIDEVTQHNAASAEESASASDELLHQAKNLDNLVKQFKLKSDEQTNENAYQVFEQPAISYGADMHHYYDESSTIAEE